MIETETPPSGTKGLLKAFAHTEASLLNDPTVPQTVLFPDLFDRPLVATFDQAHASSDGGAILLKAADRAVGLVAALARALPDPRVATRVTHAWPDVLAQRIFGIACGYPDANDADGLANDPIQKLLLDRDPVTGGRLASQPTVSRFENAVTSRALYGLGEALTDTVIARHRRRKRRARRITIDLDVTEDTPFIYADATSIVRPNDISISGRQHVWASTPRVVGASGAQIKASDGSYRTT